jgi:glycosyltransferase
MYIDSNVISLVADAFSDSAMQITYADLQYIHQTDTNRIVRTWKTGRFSRKKFYYGWMPPHPTLFVRRNVYEQIGLFNLSMRSSADYELMLRAFLKHQITAHYIPQIIVKMRAGGISNASIRNRLRANREDRQAWKMNGLQPYFFTLYIKPIRKVSQFLIK